MQVSRHAPRSIDLEIGGETAHEKERVVVREMLDDARQDDVTEPAFTTRPRRLLMIGRMQPGHEREVLEAHERLPFDVADAAGIDAVEAFIGSGHYALLLEIEAEDAQESLATYFNDARVREFHAELQLLVSGLPIPDWDYAAPERFHDDDSAVEGKSTESGPSYSSADLPLAASVYHWKRDGAER